MTLSRTVSDPGLMTEPAEARDALIVGFMSIGYRKEYLKQNHTIHRERSDEVHG